MIDTLLIVLAGLLAVDIAINVIRVANLRHYNSLLEDELDALEEAG